MGYKMKQDESPVTYTPPTGTLGYKPGTFTSGATGVTGATGAAGASGAAGAAGGGMPGLGAVAGAAGGIIDMFKPEDPTAKGYKAASVGSKALEYGAMGAALGPIGAGVGAVVGGTIGAIQADKEAEAARKAKKEFNIQTGIGDANAQLMENKYGKGEDLGDTKPLAINKKGKIKEKMKPIKKLGAITGTMSPNMSMAQYKGEMKFSKIAKKLEPINVIKSDKGFATPGTEFKDNSGTNNQPNRVTSGDRAKKAVKKAVKLSGAGGIGSVAITGY